MTSKLCTKLQSFSTFPNCLKSEVLSTAALNTQSQHLERPVQIPAGQRTAFWTWKTKANTRYNQDVWGPCRHQAHLSWDMEGFIYSYWYTDCFSSLKKRQIFRWQSVLLLLEEQDSLMSIHCGFRYGLLLFFLTFNTMYSSGGFRITLCGVKSNFRVNLLRMTYLTPSWFQLKHG